ncbi:MAG: chitobiase/beta-hexosaminidase C-terminal domain-containing protein [Bryobacteraceae bacterium]
MQNQIISKDDKPGTHLLHRRRWVASRSAFTIYLLWLTAAVLPGHANAQTFAPVPALNFSIGANTGNPLTQVITVTSTGANFNFFGTVSTSSGGSWLQINPSNFGCCGISTPQAIQVSATPGTLTPGTYNGQILFTAGSNSLTVPVTMVIHPVTSAFLDQIAGGLTFTLQTHGKNPPGQSLEVRNGGAGALNWTASTSTADGGGWLSVSPGTGAAPSKITVAIQAANLPGGGLTAGTFTGQVLLSGGGDKETIPITAIVNDSTFEQINPLSFVKTFSQWDPLPQVTTVASPGANFDFFGTAVSSTGGNWLQISPSNYGCCGLSTPQAITVSAHPAVTLAAGTYVSEILFKSSDGKQIMPVPVTMKVQDTTPHFDDVAGAAEFSMQMGSAVAPPAMELQIRNAASGTLNWTASTSTADGNAWLKLSAASGTTPASLSVSVILANLPGGGLTAGLFAGQVLLSSSGGPVTIPVTMNVGASVFKQVNPLDFTKEFGGPNPLSQVFTVASTGTNFNIFASAVSTSGNNNWLQISPSNFGCCGILTPQVISVSANPAVVQAAGSYTAEIIVTSSDGTQSMTIPVTLTIASGSAPFFDTLPGQLTFSMMTGGTAPPGQVLEIRNAGPGSLTWTASATTSDGGAWLKITPASGTAPSVPTVTVVPANVPGGGLVAGTFTGQVLLKGPGGEVSVPVTFAVGPSPFREINALDFTKVYGGADPLPQRIEVSTPGTNFNFFASAQSFSGTANWLQISPSNYGCCGVSTPQVITVNVVTSANLDVGTYTGQVYIVAAGGQQSVTVPVTLTVVAQNTPSMFDTLPGQVSFSMMTNGTAPPAQPLEIRNAGTGTLTWTASVSTADSGAWLKITPATGTAPSVPSVSVVPASLPGGGQVAGTFTGQVTLVASGQRVTIPVTMVVGNPVFRQINPLDFTKVFGGPNPLPQVIEVPSTSTDFNFFASVSNSTGGNWLQISPSNFGCCGLSTTRILTVSVSPLVTQAAGTYTGAIFIVSSDGKQSLNVPVNLTISAASVPYFDDMPSAIDFFQATGGAAPAAQTVPIRNGGAGTLNWTASLTTADGGKWLKISAGSGTAPSTLSVSVVPASLPGGGLVSGTFNGQIVLVTNGDRQTIPVNYQVGAAVFQQLPPLSFSKPFGGSNPSPKTFTVTSTGANFNVFGATATSTGGSWLQISPSNYGCCGLSTPLLVTVSVNPDTTLPAGQYVAEVIFQSSTGSADLIVPVTLTITSTTPTATPAFTPPGGTYDSAQSVVITDAAKGSAIYYTTDGSTPTTSSPRYTGPIPVTATETIKAIATSPGQPQSAVASATYTITAPKADVPMVTQTIAITESTPGATVHYTTDGSTPTASSPVYTGPIMLTTGSILKFIAIAPGFSPSDVRTVTTTIQ